MLVRAIIPARNGRPRAFFISGFRNDIDYLSLLFEMYNPFSPSIVVPSLVPVTAIAPQLGLTNLQPFCLSMLDPSHTRLIYTLFVKMSVSPRNMILSGDPNLLIPPSTTKLQTGIMKVPLDELRSINMLRIGAEICRRVMRKEAVFGA